MEYNYNTLICTSEDHIMLIKINHPEVLNALNAEASGELGDMFIKMKDDDERMVEKDLPLLLTKENPTLLVNKKNNKH